ncbi:tetrapyrrole-binding protein, chloroplastic [Senna tora]|uniref:Tetrapyrrole-binding protein, chloroplastic n=1 Tax=Senna tora TaxID=362788 RepID=A0A834W158_9FABA|nr:tetrapyrrole-binding protein, chloroplastic [Senna tora]
MAHLLLLQSYPESIVPMANKVVLDAVAKCSNVVISPLSFQALLSLIALGSTGPTHQQILHFLGKSPTENREQLFSLCTQIANLTLPNENRSGHFGAPILEFTNAIWLHQNFNFTQSFEAKVQQLFKAESRIINHGHRIDEIAKEINSWAASVSKGLISQVLPHDPMLNQPALVLASALYFKAKWAWKFDTFSSTHRHFYMLNGTCVSAPFMTSAYKSPLFRHSNGFKVVALPYHYGKDDRRFSMYIFLPDHRNGLPNLIQTFTHNSCSALIQNLELKKVPLLEFWVPKFKISFDFEASERLKEMGLTLPFQRSNQDLNEMVVSHKGDSLYLSKVCHKACIEVNEEGTEFVALSISDFQPFTGAPPPPPIQSFVADHPFFFIIREEISSAVICKLNNSELSPSIVPIPYSIPFPFVSLTHSLFFIFVCFSSLSVEMATNSLHSIQHHHHPNHSLLRRHHLSDTPLFLKTTTNPNPNPSLSLSLVQSPPSTLTTFSVSPITSTSPSTSQAVSFDLLRDLLSANNFRQADEETRRLLIVLAGEAAQKRGYVFFSEVQFISTDDLKTIDELWRQYSDNKFGYSVQKRIFEKVEKDFTKFFLKVGWMKKLDTEVEQYNYRSFPTEFVWELNDDTPEGHLPLTNALRGTQLLANILAHPAFHEDDAVQQQQDDASDNSVSSSSPSKPFTKRIFKTDYSF